MRAAILLLLAFALAANADSSRVALKTLCTPLTKNEQGSVPWPWPVSGSGAGRKLKSADAELPSRKLQTVTMAWQFWKTTKGQCTTTPTLPKAFVKAATGPHQTVAPGGNCTNADFIAPLTQNLLAKYKSKCPKTTASNLSLARICDYQYGARSASYIVGTLACKGNSTSTLKVWAEMYMNPNSNSTGTWYY